MIKANELRLGNYVNDKREGLSIVSKIRKYDNRVGITPLTFKNYVFHNTVFEPIPLTPEILERCGLKKELFEMSGCEVWHVPNTLWRVARSYRDENEYKLWHERISPPTWNLKTLKYLHELQNIIFALTGEELNYTP